MAMSDWKVLSGTEKYGRLGLNIPRGNKLGIGCEIINTTSGYTYYIL